uniref:Uncharacterized protein n=1 Tax=Parascaris equorum TaxID=6256 RepID=A0A914R734_PAREQ
MPIRERFSRTYDIEVIIAITLIKIKEGFVESEVKKALLESIYEQRKRDRRKELEKEEKEKKEEEKRKKQKKEEERDPDWLPSTRDFVRFISLNYSNDIDDLPADLRQFHSLPLEHIPMPTDPEK